MPGPLLVYLGNKPVNNSAIHEEIADLQLPDFLGVTLRGFETDAPIIEVYLGPGWDPDVLPVDYEYTEHTQGMIDAVMDVIANHDWRRNSRLGNARRQQKLDDMQLRDELQADYDALSSHASPTARQMLASIRQLEQGIEAQTIDDEFSDPDLVGPLWVNEPLDPAPVRPPYVEPSP